MLYAYRAGSFKSMLRGDLCALSFLGVFSARSRDFHAVRPRNVYNRNAVAKFETWLQRFHRLVGSIIRVQDSSGGRLLFLLG